MLIVLSEGFLQLNFWCVIRPIVFQDDIENKGRRRRRKTLNFARKARYCSSGFLFFLSLTLGMFSDDYSSSSTRFRHNSFSVLLTKIDIRDWKCPSKFQDALYASDRHGTEHNGIRHLLIPSVERRPIKISRFLSLIIQITSQCRKDPLYVFDCIQRQIIDFYTLIIVLMWNAFHFIPIHRASTGKPCVAENIHTPCIVQVFNQ